MRKILLVCLLGLWSVLGQTSEIDRGSISYTGSRQDQSLSMQTETMRTEYRWVQVPYQEQVCRIETGYRRECRQEPPRQVCRMVNKPVCRMVRECRTDRNGNQVCRQRRVCQDRPVRVCRNEPGRQVCRDVPYQQRVCRMETRYRQERRAYQVVDGRTFASLAFNFTPVGNASGLRSEVTATLDRNLLNIRAEDFSSPKRALIYSVLDSRSQRGSDLYLSKNYSIRVVDADELFRPILEQSSASEIVQGVISFSTGVITHPVDHRFRLRAVSGAVLFDGELGAGQYRLIQVGSATQVIIDLRSLLGRDLSGQELALDFTIEVKRDYLFNQEQFSRFENRQSFSRIWR